LRKLRFYALVHVAMLLLSLALGEVFHLPGLGAGDAPGTAVQALVVGTARTTAISLCYLVIAYLYLIPSAKHFSTWRPSGFSGVPMLLRIGYVWGCAITILSNILLCVAIVVGSVAAILWSSLALIGEVGSSSAPLSSGTPSTRGGSASQQY